MAGLAVRGSPLSGLLWPAAKNAVSAGINALGVRSGVQRQQQQKGLDGYGCNSVDKAHHVCVCKQDIA